MIIAKQEKANWFNVEILEKTERGSGGFRHTGKE
jgi:dUTPase